MVVPIIFYYSARINRTLVSRAYSRLHMPRYGSLLIFRSIHSFVITMICRGLSLVFFSHKLDFWIWGSGRTDAGVWGHPSSNINRTLISRAYRFHIPRCGSLLIFRSILLFVKIMSCTGLSLVIFSRKLD